LRAFSDGPCNRRNPIFETGDGFQTLVAPPGLSRVPFLWRHAATGRERRMEAFGGLIGVSQEPQTLALRPKVGWAVREAERMDVVLACLTAEHTTFPGVRIEGRTHLPPDLARFYHSTDGAELFGRGGAPGCRIISLREMEPLDWGENPDSIATLFVRAGRVWHRLAWLAGGGWLAINLDGNRPDPRPKPAGRWSFDPEFSPICRGTVETQGLPGQNPVVALSFTELLERMLGQGETHYWLDSQFTGYGDAEQYTRRD
jgi:hypothetical protein